MSENQPQPLEKTMKDSCSSGTCPISNPNVVAFFVPFFIIFFLETVVSPPGGTLTPQLWQRFVLHSIFQATIFGLFSLFLCRYLARRKRRQSANVIAPDASNSG